MNDQIKFERERLLEMQDVMTRQLEQQSAIEKSISAMQQQANEHKYEVVSLKSVQDLNEKLSDELTVVRQKMHANVQASVMAIMTLQGKIEESVRALALKGENNLSTSTNTELNANSDIRVPVHALPTEEELIIHERLLHQFFVLVRPTTVSGSDLLHRFRSNLGELYTAISMKYNLGRGLMYESVYGYLHTHLPHLAPATPVICFLHDGHEVEYLELITLDILGLTVRSPSTWLEVRLPGSHKRSFYYFSSLVGLSQRERPKWVGVLNVEIGVCRISDFCSICPRLSLRNPEWANNDAPYTKLLQSKVVSLVLSRRPDLQGSIDVILNSYAGREETLLKHLCVRQ
ncbi:uncharacterized protein TM35_000131020 [Trypanosoma theileri]|uniref:Uncharacterized protein n=1 Tax=Trypanosoma theileri TaxID=67003 RepID=A0A1X0NX28_9TRYP|nr:uncharacterized protein TM35_000131020 [Trypanosoma theileri]ORC89098.1 hypothetical protein TM35_000131020 [Trypanosoma theileri]